MRDLCMGVRTYVSVMLRNVISLRNVNLRSLTECQFVLTPGREFLSDAPFLNLVSARNSC